MSAFNRYAMPSQTDWAVPSDFETACDLMRDRFLAEEVWERLRLPVDGCTAHARGSSWMNEFRSYLRRHGIRPVDLHP